MGVYVYFAKITDSLLFSAVQYTILYKLILSRQELHNDTIMHSYSDDPVLLIRLGNDCQIFALIKIKLR